MVALDGARRRVDTPGAQGSRRACQLGYAYANLYSIQELWRGLDLATRPATPEPLWPTAPPHMRLTEGVFVPKRCPSAGGPFVVGVNVP